MVSGAAGLAAVVGSAAGSDFVDSTDTLGTALEEFRDRFRQGGDAHSEGGDGGQEDLELHDDWIEDGMFIEEM